MPNIGTAFREEIVRLAADCGAGNVRVFGSVARGEADGLSEVDLLVDLEAGAQPARSGEIAAKAGAKLLAVKGDVLSARGLRDRVRGTVRRDALPL